MKNKVGIKIERDMIIGRTMLVLSSWYGSTAGRPDLISFLFKRVDELSFFFDSKLSEVIESKSSSESSICSSSSS